MKQRKRIQGIQATLTKPTKWQVVCDNCYRKQYCQFVLTTDNCILFKPSDAKRLKDYHNEYITINK